MSEDGTLVEAVGLLQDLGLKEYEARCFLALTRLSTGTAKEISEVSEVPRTRVYDAIRILEAQGLVEVQHGSPRQFRAVSVEEATGTLRQRFDSRIDVLRSRLERLERQGQVDDVDRVQEVWSLTGHEGIESRTYDLLEDAASEIVLLIVEEELLTDALFDRLHEAIDRGANVVVGGETDAIVGRLESELPSVQVFETDLDWLMGPDTDEVAISRLLLVDRTKLLVSSFYPVEGHDDSHERAVFATGLENGVVVLIRRIFSSGLLPLADPAN